MYKDISLPEEGVQTSVKPVSSLIETAETVLSNAVEQARSRLMPQEQSEDLKNLLIRKDFVEYLKHALAQELAQVISTFDQRVQAVYLFDESTNPDACTEDYPTAQDLTIHMLALVTADSAALEAFIISLDRAMTQVLIDLPSKAFAQRTSFLNLLPITENDIAERRGYAVLLSSIFAPPLKIWQR